jgi:hypothetical protein
MAYDSIESGIWQVYVRPYPDVNSWHYQVSTTFGCLPLWSPNGKELFYRNDKSVMAVTVEAGQTFKCGKPEKIFEGEYGQPWDVDPNSKRVLMMKEATPDDAKSLKINIVLNWFEELKQRAPGK